MKPLAMRAAAAVALLARSALARPAPDSLADPAPAPELQVAEELTPMPPSSSPRDWPFPIPDPEAAPHTHERRFAKVTVDVPGAGAQVTGSSRLGIEAFNGIPFAEPPVGGLRLKPPVRLSRKLGRVDATGIAPACPQMFVSSEAKDALGKILTTILNIPLLKQLKGREDCLTVDVARPAGTKAGDKLPVLFWIYGGGFQLGSTSTYDATSLLTTAKINDQPFVYVAVNYRVAGFGFLGGKEVMRDGSANLGLLDQRMGLEWVADNIEAFGGDPSKVTIWGESAGAISVYDHMFLFGGNVSYHGKPLFRGAIMNSGSLVPADPVDSPKSQAIYDSVVDKAGCAGAKDTLQCLRELDYETFLRASNSPPGILSYRSLDLPYLPRPDGRVLEESPELMLAKGRYHAVPAIIGGQEDEGTIFSFYQKNLTTVDDVAEYLNQYLFQKAPVDVLKEYVQLYEPGLTQGSPFRTGIFNELHPGFKRLAAIFTDLTFVSTRRIALTVGGLVKPDVPMWAYMASYDYGTPFLGTFHASDILQIFYGIWPNHASKSCRTYYFNFLYNLDPNKGVGGFANWPQWKAAGRQLMWFKSAFRNSLLKDDFRDSATKWIIDHADVLHI